MVRTCITLNSLSGLMKHSTLAINCLNTKDNRYEIYNFMPYTSCAVDVGNVQPDPESQF